MIFAPLLMGLVLGADPVEAGRPASAWLNDWLLNDARGLIAQRSAAYEQIKTAADALAWQAARRKYLIEQIGGIPAAVRPASQTVGTLDGGDYLVEKVIYESRPGHHVTAVLYRPKHAKPPLPAMIICCGHSYDGKASDGYQRVGILAAKNGLAALCFDPIGQGERYQVLEQQAHQGRGSAQRTDARLRVVQELTPAAPPQYNPVEEHTLAGIGPILLGTNTAHYRVWDAMRSVDYLLSRPDIDPRRIGVTGNSGGGTESSYLMALDERIAAAAPGCFLTSYRRLLETVGPQDAEQNIFGQLAFGLDEADYVNLTAPRPVSILAATRDATFDIGGTWELFRDAKRFYARLGYPERVDLVETDNVHGFTIQLREAAVRWMRRWLLGVDDAVVEGEFPIFTPAQLQCTPQGQVLLMPGERSVFDLSRERSESLAIERKSRAEPQSPEQRRSAIARQIGIVPAALSAIESAAPGDNGAVWLKRAARVPLHVRMERPAQGNGELVVYLTASGTTGSDRQAEPIKSWLAANKSVAIVDLSGLGAMGPDTKRHWATGLFGPSIREFYTAYLNGRSMVGLRTEDILTASRYLSQQDSFTTVHLHAVGVTTIPALHAAALEPGRFASTTLVQSIESWHEVVTTAVPENQLLNTVHGALTIYDLPELVELAGGKTRVRREQNVDARGQSQ